MKAALALFVLSFALIGASLPMDAFRLAPDGSYPMFGAPEGNSEAYDLARKRALTAKFSLQDYGITLLVCAMTLAAFKWRPFKAPHSRLGFLILAVAAPLLSVGALVFDLIQGQARWEFPPWADSLGIPLMGIPVLFVAGLIWAFAHIILLAGVLRRTDASLTLAAIRRGHPWLLVVCVLTAILMLVAAAEGAYWYVTPGALWLYFYASIAAARQQQHGA
jgi:hypothetical protein